MSTFFQADVACPHCGEVASRSVASSINAQRSPRYRQEILERTFQRPTCGACKQHFVIDEPFIYLDLGRDQLIAVYPAGAIDEWAELEREVVATHAKGFGPEEAPHVAQALGAKLVLRTVFGLEALREKLVCAEHGIDDATLEAIKLRFFAEGRVPYESRPRLSEVVDDKLVLVCEPTPDPDAPPGSAPRQAVLRFPRELLERRFDLELPQVTGGSWVDAGRALHDRGVAAADDLV